MPRVQQEPKNRDGLTRLAVDIPATSWPEIIWVLFLSFPETSLWWWITTKSNKTSRIKLWSFGLPKLSSPIPTNLLWISPRCSYKTWSLSCLLHFDINFVAVGGGLRRRLDGAHGCWFDWNALVKIYYLHNFNGKNKRVTKVTDISNLSDQNDILQTSVMKVSKTSKLSNQMWHFAYVIYVYLLFPLYISFMFYDLKFF